jgi:hypothetical protein
MEDGTVQPENNTCRLENVGKFAVPICGHDIITEFMVEDLRTKSNRGIFLYGGLYADDDEDRFFWYVSTVRPVNLAKIPSMVSGGVKVSDYLREVMKDNRIQILYDAFERPVTDNNDDQEVDALIDLGLLTRNESGTIRTSEKGIELCGILAHLTFNHRVKPPPQQLNEIFEAFLRTGLFTEDLQPQKEPLLTVDAVIEILTERGELEQLLNQGIEKQKLRDVIQFYLCPPF